MKVHKKAQGGEDGSSHSRSLDFLIFILIFIFFAHRDSLPAVA